MKIKKLSTTDVWDAAIVAQLLLIMTSFRGHPVKFESLMAEHPHTTWFCLLDNHKLVGACRIFPQHKNHHMSAVVITHAYRNCGYVQRLLSEAKKYAKILTLDVCTENKAAMIAYIKFGFIPVSIKGNIMGMIKK